MLHVSDPSYNKTYGDPEQKIFLPLALRLKPAAQGTWTAHIKMDEQYPTREQELMVFHQASGPPTEWTASSKLGVDAGMMSIFEEDAYPDSPFDDTEFYEAMCNLSQGGGIWKDQGVVCHSGFGDGFYQVLISRNDAETIVGVKVIFITQEERDMWLRLTSQTPSEQDGETTSDEELASDKQTPLTEEK